MVSLIKDSTSRHSQEAAYYKGRPVFLPGWWKQLTKSQRWRLGLFLAFYALGTLLFAVSICHDIYFVHELKLVGLRRPGIPNQRVDFNLTFYVAVGFWDRAIEDKEAQLFSDHPVEVYPMLRLHLKAAYDLWMYCVTYSHRAVSCQYAAFLLLTLGIAGLFSAPFIFILSRLHMIRILISSTTFLFAAFLLIFAASVEYNNCVIARQIQRIKPNEFKYVSFRGRFFVTLFYPKLTPLLSVSCAFILGLLPMSFLGISLLITDNQFL